MIKQYGRFVFSKKSDGFGMICVEPYLLLSLGWNWNILHLLPFVSLERRKVWEVSAGFLVFKVSMNGLRQFGSGFKNVFCNYSKYEPNMKGEMTIRELSEAYSQDGTLFWLRFHIAETLAFVGIYDNISANHIKKTARLMQELPNFGNMKLTDLLHFFELVKAGEYGMLTCCHELLVYLLLYLIKD